jgi:hypothetical protein
MAAIAVISISLKSKKDGRMADRLENIHEFDWNIDYRRTGTPGFGDQCCDSKYAMSGTCEWELCLQDGCQAMKLFLIQVHWHLLSELLSHFGIEN